MHEFVRHPIVGLDTDLVFAALELKRRYRLSYWDAAMIVAAHALGASTLYSEDLSDGQRYGDVTVRNPFL